MKLKPDVTTPESDRDQMKSAIRHCLQTNRDLSPLVRTALESYISLLESLDAKSSAMRKLLRELRTSFGIIPKSEKQGNYGKKKPVTRKDLLAAYEDSESKRKRYGKNMRKQHKKSMEIELRLKELDEIELSPEELAEEAEDNRIFSEGIRLGDGRVDPECCLPAEALFSGLVSEHETDEEECLLSDEAKQGSDRVFFEDRQRLDLEISVKTLNLRVEKAEVKDENGETTIISASTTGHGPAGMNVTWNFLSQMSLLVGQFGMPMTRLATLISTPEETIGSDRIVRYFHYVARRLLPVYLKQFEELASADILSGDDTTTRTLEVTRALKQGVSTWDDYSDQQTAKKTMASAEPEKASLCRQVSAELGFVSHTKEKTPKPKRQFNTTVIHGRMKPLEPRSTVVQFRSHFGSFADLVLRLLDRRNPEKRELSIVSDLSSTNFLSHDNFSVTQSGCTAHARRRFAKADDGDPEMQKLVMSIFTVLYSNEECLDMAGRNKENTESIRQRNSKPLWENILHECKSIAEKSSASTGLGEAARYVIRNYEALTAHLSDPRLPHTNDQSERLIRPEKQIQAAANFRNTIEGRTALDIIRSLIQTCSAAEVNAADYLNWVLRGDDSEILNDPGSFTPYFFGEYVLE